MGTPVTLSGSEYLIVLAKVCATCALVGCAVLMACILNPNGPKRLVGETPFIQNLTIVQVVATVGALSIGG